MKTKSKTKEFNLNVQAVLIDNSSKEILLVKNLIKDKKEWGFPEVEICSNDSSIQESLSRQVSSDFGFENITRIDLLESQMDESDNQIKLVFLIEGDFQEENGSLEKKYTEYIWIKNGQIRQSGTFENAEIDFQTLKTITQTFNGLFQN